MISHNDKIYRSLGCTYYDTWDAHYCTNNDIALLQIDSLDPDTLIRSV